MFGSFYFGQSSFAGAPNDLVPLPTTRPDCGGVFGSATFGQPYFGDHVQCGDAPVPPTPEPSPSPRTGGGGGYWLDEPIHIHDLRPHIPRIVVAHAWDRAISHSRASANAIREADVTHGKSGPPKSTASARMSVNRAASARASCFSKASARLSANRSAMARSVGLSRGVCPASAIRVGTHASARFVSRHRASSHLEAVICAAYRPSRSNGSAQADHLVEFTQEQIEMLTLIASRTFFDS